MKLFLRAQKVNVIFATIAVLALGILILVNAIALKLSSRFNLEADLTANAAYRIGGDTEALLAALGAPVDIYVFSNEGGFSGSAYLTQAKRVIDQYPKFSDMVSLRYVDYSADPSFAAEFSELKLSHGDVVVKCGDKIKHIMAANLFYYAYTPRGDLEITASRAEEALTSAVAGVTNAKDARVTVLTGNGVAEAPIFSALLSDNNYIMGQAGVATAELENSDVALLLAPTIDLSEGAIRALDAFLFNEGHYGKTLFYAADAGQGRMPNLDAFLAEWGVAFTDGAVFETAPERVYQYQPFYPTAEHVKGDRYTETLRDGSMPFLMPLSRPMEILFTVKDRRYVETALSFGVTSGVRPAGTDAEFTADKAERRGPIPALAVSGYTAAGETAPQSKIVVSSSVRMLDAIALQNSSLTNAEFLLNLFADITDKPGGANIRSKTLEGKTLGVTSAQASVLGVILVGAIPGAIFLTGVAVWLVRRFN